MNIEERLRMQTTGWHGALHGELTGKIIGGRAADRVPIAGADSDGVPR